MRMRNYKAGESFGGMRASLSGQYTGEVLDIDEDERF